MKLFYLLFICISPTIIQAQVSEVKEKLENSNKHLEEAFEEIKLATSKMEDCENSRAIDHIRSCAEDVRDFLRTANGKISFAKNEAYLAHKEASDINCSETEEKADKAKGYFKDAESMISSAMKELGRVRYGAEVDVLKQYMLYANNYINQALIRLNYASNELYHSILALEDCI
ncbi:MAG: hypothetical protein P8X62_10815 [Flavobacteriaceae bacterium]